MLWRREACNISGGRRNDGQDSSGKFNLLVQSWSSVQALVGGGRLIEKLPKKWKIYSLETFFFFIDHMWEKEKKKKDDSLK